MKISLSLVRDILLSQNLLLDVTMIMIRVIIYLLQIVQTASETLSLVVKRSGFEADHSPPSSAEVKNEKSYTPLPLTHSCTAEGQIYLYCLLLLLIIFNI
jgi:hypothetical protein